VGIQNGEVEDTKSFHFLSCEIYDMEKQMNIPIKKETRLEVAVETNQDINALLDAKVEHYKELNMPVEESIADYISLGIQGQKEKIEQYKQYKKELDLAIKALQELEKQTAKEVYEWMESNGLDKLKGIHCSSVTCKPASVSVRTKIVRDITDKELLEKGYAHEVETISDIPSGIKINNRRAS